MTLFLSSFVSGWAAVLRSPGHAHPIRKFIPKAVAERFLPATLQCNLNAISNIGLPILRRTEEIIDYLSSN